jgi:Capsule polysaccharide biosynthesis protein
VRFLFTTLQFRESDFYGRVGAELSARGHDVAHVAFSRRAATALRGKGFRAECLPDRMAALEPIADPEAEGRAVVARYGLPTLRDVWKPDRPCEGKPDAWCVERTVRHFRALEAIFDELRPEVVVPEVGSETMRTAAHEIALDRGAEVLFLFYTIFPNPLRLYRDTMHAPIVAEAELRELAPEERVEVEDFIARFTAADRPIREYRAATVTPAKLRDFARHIAVSAIHDSDNEYLEPHRFVTNLVRERARAAAARRLYEPLDPNRPFVYFPLHVVDDYKIKRVIPHCYDQASIIEQVADALPHGYELVLKEHPMSIGRNRLALLRRLARIPNARLVAPHTSSHDVMRRAEAVAVISSTVGLEALLHDKPVLTLGQPFYAGYGVTLDVDSFREIREAVPALLRFYPDHERILRFLHAAMRACYPGKPVLVDDSDANAAALAGSLDAAVRRDAPAAAAVA